MQVSSSHPQAKTEESLLTPSQEGFTIIINHNQTCHYYYNYQSLQQVQVEYNYLCFSYYTMIKLIYNLTTDVRLVGSHIGICFVISKVYASAISFGEIKAAFVISTF